MKVTINAKDLSDEGLVIVKSSDSDFNNLSLDFLKTHSIDEFDKVKPLSIFVKNTSSKTVVAHAIVWECFNSIGEKRPHIIRYIESPALTDGMLGPRTDELSDQTIYPKSYKLLSLLPISETNEGGGDGESYRKINDNSPTKKIPESDYQNRNELIRNQIFANCSELFPLGH